MLFKKWDLADIRRLRAYRDVGVKMAVMCDVFREYGRDDIVEALDALVRTDSAHAAVEHVNRVQACRWAEVPMVNGKPQSQVLRRPLF